MTSQPVDNQSYNDVYVIKDDQVSQKGNHYLLDLPIRETEDAVVLYNASTIPNELFWKSPFCYPKQKEITLIVNVSPDVPGTVCIGEEPVAEFNVYTIKRTGEGTMVDSTRVYNVTISEKMPAPLSDKEMHYYFTESYGSSCCPTDPKWETAMRAELYLKEFETTHDSSVGSVLSRITGKEGEHAIFYGLDNLAGEELLDFIIGRMHSIVPNRHLKKYVFDPMLFTASIAENWRTEPFRE